MVEIIEMSVIVEITRSHVSTNEISHASTPSQHSKENFYSKNCLRMFSAMTGNPRLIDLNTSLKKVVGN